MMRMMSLTFLIAVMLLLASLVRYQSSGQHPPCNPTNEKSRLKGKIKPNITVDNALSVIISLSMSVLHAIEYFISHQSMMNQAFCSGEKFRVSKNMSLNEMLP